MTPDTPTAAAPSADPLYQQCETGVRQMEAQLGRPFDDNSARLSASLAVLAHESGLTRVDHVLLSEQATQVASGELVFLVQGALGDPAQLRTHMRTEDAIALTVQQSAARLQQLQDAHRLTVGQSQAQVQQLDDPVQRR
jgi:hypothetical protein